VPPAAARPSPRIPAGQVSRGPPEGVNTSQACLSCPPSCRAILAEAEGRPRLARWVRPPMVIFLGKHFFCRALDQGRSRGDQAWASGGGTASMSGRWGKTGVCSICWVERVVGDRGHLGADTRHFRSIRRSGDTSFTFMLVWVRSRSADAQRGIRHRGRH